MDYQINFPNLGIRLGHVIKNFKIGNFTIAIYGITMAVALLVGLWLTLRRAKETKQDQDKYISLFIFLLIFGFTGARIYYVACQWSYYKDNLIQIFNLRAGGIAMYGGIIAGIITVTVFCKVKKLHFFDMVDTIAIGITAGQIIGRWGNFFNREAFGRYTNNLLAMQLPVSAVRQNEITQEMWDHLVTVDGVKYIQVHPTFLYEGLWNLGVLILLIVFRNKRKFRGEMFFRYLIGYGLGRFWVESLRTDQLIIPHTSIPISMAVSAAAVILGIVCIILGRSGKAFRPVAAAAAEAEEAAEAADAVEEASESVEETGGEAAEEAPEVDSKDVRPEAAEDPAEEPDAEPEPEPNAEPETKTE